jgi:hypothetical protein
MGNCSANERLSQKKETTSPYFFVYMYVMQTKPIQIALFLGLMALASLGLKGQDTSLIAKGTTMASPDAMRVAQPFQKGTAELPEALGGGVMPTQSLMITAPNQRGGVSMSPEDLGVDNLLPGKWLDNRYYFFIGTDAVDIQGYFVYDASNDQVYPCDFEVGEALGYEEITPGKQFKPELEEKRLTGYSFE